MTHAELVRSGTDLLAETPWPERWLAGYDRALESSNDEQLIEFVNELGRELPITVRIAA